MNLNWKKNEVTGAMEADFPAKLLSVSETVLETNTDNKTKYRICDIEFEGANGTTQASAFMWDNNFAYLKKGDHPYELNNSGRHVAPEGKIETKLARVIFPEGSDTPLIYVSHLEGNSPRASAADFGFDAQAVTKLTAAKAEVNP